MTIVWGKFCRFFRAADGATLVEYGVALLVVIIVGAASMTGLGGVVGVVISDTASAF
jgi:Flp pilus assembly pilin Flp